jgi:DNA-binding LacI/PurR family transcriptional regulator
MKNAVINQDRIYLALQEKINAGIYPEDSILPPLRQLAVQFDSSPGTVRQALLKLQNEGIVSARHGSGYFVHGRKQRKTRRVLMLERTGNQHLYSRFISEFRLCFNEYPEYSVILEDLGIFQQQPDLLQSRLLDEVAHGLDAIFFNGEHITLPREAYDKLQEHTKLFYYFNTKANFTNAGVPGVATDWIHGQYISIRHLIEIGCRNILLLTGSVRHDGALAAQADTGAKARLTFVETLEEAGEKLAGERFDGLYSSQDPNAIKLIQQSRGLGYKIPGDIAVIGYYNTPWSEHPECPLTSVSVCEAEMIRKMFHMFTGQEQLLQLTQLPRLIIRETTAGFQPQ